MASQASRHVGKEVNFDIASWAGLLFIVLSLFTIGFQVALLFGAPWGEWTMGGRVRGVLTGVWRWVPALSILILLAFIAIVAARSGLALPGLREWSNSLIWVVVAYCSLGCVANAATPSVRERRLWLPVLVLLLGSSLIVAFD